MKIYVAIKCKMHISNLKIYCNKIVPFVDFSKKQISSYNCTTHKILMNEISLILPNFPKDRKEKRSIIASLVTGFIGLAYEGISSYLHNKRQKALHKAFVAMENKVNLQCNKIIHLENSMVMCGIYNSDTLEKLVDMVHRMYNTQLEMINYLLVNLNIDIIGIYLRVELVIMPSILSYI